MCMSGYLIRKLWIIQQNGKFNAVRIMIRDTNCKACPVVLVLRSLLRPNIMTGTAVSGENAEFIKLR